MTLRCFIVDDEPLARLRIEDLVEDAKDADVVGSFGDPRRALDRILTDAPDLVFLDVQMPGMTGIELLGEMRATLDDGARPYVVLVTAFDDYALEAFEFEALDYLVKPFDDGRFHATLRRANERIALRESAQRAATSEADPVRLGEGDAALRVWPASVTWVEAAGHLVLVHMRTRTAHTRARMAEVEETLAPHGFVRVHRSALVNVSCVETVEVVGGERQLRLVDGSMVSVSRRRWERVSAALE